MAHSCTLHVMKLSDYARSNDIGYRAAWNRFKAGKIPGAWQDNLGAIHVPDPREQHKDKLMDNRTVVYRAPGGR